MSPFKYSFLLFLSLTLLSSCNKSSLIEALQPQKSESHPVVKVFDTSIALNKTFPTIKIDLDSFSVTLLFSTIYLSGYTDSNYNATDTVRSTRISAIGSVGGLYFDDVDDQIRKYNVGDTLSGTVMPSKNYQILLFAKRSPPFTPSSKYVVVKGNYINPLSGIKANSLIPSFATPDNGYIMFKLVKYGTPSITYYCWINLTINENTISIRKYAYQRGQQLKAGME